MGATSSAGGKEQERSSLPPVTSSSDTAKTAAWYTRSKSVLWDTAKREVRFELYVFITCICKIQYQYYYEMRERREMPL